MLDYLIPEFDDWWIVEMFIFMWNSVKRRFHLHFSIMNSNKFQFKFIISVGVVLSNMDNNNKNQRLNVLEVKLNVFIFHFLYLYDFWKLSNLYMWKKAIQICHIFRIHLCLCYEFLMCILLITIIIHIWKKNSLKEIHDAKLKWIIIKRVIVNNYHSFRFHH